MVWSIAIYNGLISFQTRDVKQCAHKRDKAFEKKVLIRVKMMMDSLFDKLNAAFYTLWQRESSRTKGRHVLCNFCCYFRRDSMYDRDNASVCVRIACARARLSIVMKPA